MYVCLYESTYKLRISINLLQQFGMCDGVWLGVRLYECLESRHQVGATSAGRRAQPRREDAHVDAARCRVCGRLLQGFTV